MSDRSTRLAGYAHLIERFGVAVVPNWHQSAVAAGNSVRVERDGGRVSEVYTGRHWPGETVGDHLTFALKYDGTNLHVLAALFDVIPADELVRHIEASPMGKYARRLWFLYEWCTGRELAIAAITRVGYVPLIDSAEQYTTVGRPVSRQRVYDNLLGTKAFCPTVRRTDALAAAEAARLDEQGRRVIGGCPPDVLRRAMHYLYTKETRSSFEIEHEQPTADRVDRFVSLLHAAERESYVEKAKLVELQNQIVDPRFREADYRSLQNYVGQTVRPGYEKVHFVPPKPGDVPALMAGWMASDGLMIEAGVHPVVHAAVIAYGFVFVHPFEDGNGRSSRFLIHNVLARRSFTPPGVIFPVSAVMLKDAASYDRSLEAFSGPLRPPLIDYRIDDRGAMAVLNDTAPLYRFMDLTAQAEALFEFVRVTVEHDLSDAIQFLYFYDAAKQAIRAIADIPDRLIDLFIHCCGQNHGKLGKGKRKSHFARLTDDEIARMEHAVQDAQQGNVVIEPD